MRIGIVPVINPSVSSGGGVYQYSMTMLRALHEQTGIRYEDEFVVFLSKSLEVCFRAIKRSQLDV